MAPQLALSATPDECAAILTSMLTAKKMYAARGSERDRIFREEPHYIREREGMPAHLEIVPAEGTIFRHYTSKEGLQKILDAKSLQAGWTPFYYSGSMSDYNVDLTGIFITTPKTEPHSVGVRPENSAFVDFKLDPGTGILFLRDGIFLIPGTPRPEDWKVRIYQGPDRAYYSGYAEEFARWDREGIPQPIRIPIEIVDYSK